jgi:hypothetical protein
MQAGLVKKQLSFREIFTTMAILLWWIYTLMRNQTRVKEFPWLSTAQEQTLPEEAPKNAKKHLTNGQKRLSIHLGSY